MNPRVLKCHKDAVAEVFARRFPGVTVDAGVVEELATAVVLAEDGEHQRYVIVTRLDRPDRVEIDVYGVYASRGAATASLEVGIGRHPEQRGAVFPISPAPREWKPPRKKKGEQ